MVLLRVKLGQKEKNLKIFHKRIEKKLMQIVQRPRAITLFLKVLTKALAPDNPA
jgi:hypothetical protein